MIRLYIPSSDYIVHTFQLGDVSICVISYELDQNAFAVECRKIDLGPDHSKKPIH